MGVVNGVKKAAARPGRLQMAMMMLMVGTVAFAQNTAGDYSAGTDATHDRNHRDCEVRTYRCEALLCHRRCSCCRRCDQRLHQDE